MVRGKLRALSASKRKLERAYTSSLTAHLKALEQKEANAPKRSRRQEVIKLRAEINQVETKRTIQRINKTRSWFFEKINNIDKHLARRTRGYRDSIQINKIRNEKGDITMKYILKELFCLLNSSKYYNHVLQTSWKYYR